MVDLLSWWRDMRPRCAPYGDVRPLQPTALSAALAPEPCAYFELLGERSWFGHRVDLDFLLLSAGAIAELLHGDYAEAARGWLPFASRGDRTGWYLSPESGLVARTYDDAPWLAGPDEHDVTTFAAWRAEVATRRMYDRVTATLIALTDDERVALDGALASEDPRDVLLFARDLQFQVTPDPAWSFRRGAPDRMMRVDDWTPPTSQGVAELYRGDETIVTLLSAQALAGIDRVRDLHAAAARLDGTLLLVRDLEAEVEKEDEPKDVEQARRDAWARWSDDD